MKLIVGLGNPGLRYQNTKHNVGFRVIDGFYDKFLSTQSGGFTHTKRATSICNSLIMQTNLQETPIIFAKPMTYMNNSGSAVSALVRRFDIQLSDLLIVYDDVHLDIGMIRIRRNGSDGGQKGMQSIIRHLGTIDFPRLRIGIGEPTCDIVDYVLSEFTKEEETTIEQTMDRSVEAIVIYLNEGIQTAMNKYNGRLITSMADTSEE